MSPIINGLAIQQEEELEGAQPSPERGLFTLMQTDVCGFSKAVSSSEELVAIRVAQDIEKFEKIANKHEGRVVTHRGDGLKLVFPSPASAIEAAIEMQSAVIGVNANVGSSGLRIQHRIGIHIGEVILVRNQVLGKIPAIAKRLEEICPPGKFCYSDEIHRVIAQKMQFPRVFSGHLEVKNIPGALKVWIGSSPDDLSDTNPVITKTVDNQIQAEQRAANQYQLGLIRGFATGVFAMITLALVIWAFKVTSEPIPQSAREQAKQAEGSGR